MTKKLLLIDGNAIIHRAYHALPPLTTKKGELVNAVYGFSSTVLNVIEKFKPDYVVASFDLAGPTFRHKKFKDYKATRTKAPDDLYAQIPLVKDVVRAFNIPIYEEEGFEADDVIGTIARNVERGTWNEKKKIETVIITGDLDALQLVDDNTSVYTMRRGISDSVMYDEGAVRERYGISPEQLKDFKGLRGDASDNIPGVKGIGEKGAISLIREYGSLEKVYENIDKIKGATRDKLERDKAQAFMSKDLGTIKTDIKLDFDLKKALFDDFDREKIMSLFQELNFFSLIKRLPGGDEKKKDKRREKNGVSDFKYEIIGPENEKEFINKLEKQKELAISLEVGLSGRIAGMAFSWKTGRASFLEIGENGMGSVKLILQNKKIKKIGHDLKYVYKILKKNGTILEGIHFDVMLATYVLDPGAKADLEMLVLEEIGEEFKEEAGQLSLDDMNGGKTREKLCQKVDYVFKLKGVYQDKIKKISAEQKSEKNNLENIFEKMEMPLLVVLSEMELSGIKLNTFVLNGISENIGKKINVLEKTIHKLGKSDFNINSPKQLSKILFEKLNLPTNGIKKTKTNFSTAAAELEKLRDEHEIIPKIESYRELFKLKSTYLDALPELIKEDGRIHTTYNQAVTATGRLSSENPNLQNIPIRTDLGKLMRTAFEAEDGKIFVAADYSQIDLRAVAHLSGDKKLIEAFIDGEDIHKTTAAEVNKVSLSQVTAKMRSSAKELNFGIIYGMGTFGFSQAAGISREDARKFIDAYMERFPDVATYIRKTKEFAKKNGYVETEMGRRRYLPEINSPNFQVQSGAERMAINMPVQGMSADIMKLAMNAVYEKYKGSEEVKMILQVHDEIILEVSEKLAEGVSREVKEIMENVYKLKVPLIVDIKTGDNWGEI